MATTGFFNFRSHWDDMTEFMSSHKRIFNTFKFDFPVEENQICLLKIRKIGYVGKNFDSMYRVKVEVADSFDSKYLSKCELKEKLSEKTFVFCGHCFRFIQNGEGNLKSLHYCRHCGKQLIR